jgi:hypothetical protein
MTEHHELTVEVLDAVDAIMAAHHWRGQLSRGQLERLLSLAWLEGRKSGLDAARHVYSNVHA